MTATWTVTMPMPVGPSSPVVVDNVSGFTATWAPVPVPYLVVNADPATFATFEAEADRRRRECAAGCGLDCSPSVPKLALVTQLDDDRLGLRTRLAHGDKFHPAAPATGLLAVGAVAFTPGTPVACLTAPDAEALTFATPRGDRIVRSVTCPDGTAGLSLDLGSVELS